MPNYNNLDQPVWHSLSQTHSKFALDYGEMKFYKPQYCPFGGMVTTVANSSAISEYAKLASSFFVVGQCPELSGQLKLVRELVCLQMVLEKPIEMQRNQVIAWLENEQLLDLYRLVNAVQPGYFKRDTPELGNYYGIYREGKLVAATGERMKMEAFTEVSAVVTHPEFTGQGLAKQLVTHVCQSIFAQGKIPYLHVAASNIGAVKLYEKLGFKTRRNMSFWQIEGI